MTTPPHLPTRNPLSLATELANLADEARRLSRSFEVPAPLSPEAALATCVSGLTASTYGSPLRQLSVGARLLALHLDSERDAELVSRRVSGRGSCVSCRVGQVVYVLVTGGGRDDEGDPAQRRALAVWRDVSRTSSTRTALSSRIARADDLAEAARDVRDLLILMQEADEHLGLVDESWARLLTFRLAGLLPAATPTSAVFDTIDASPFVDSLVAWLDADGDVPRAAALQDLHPNTLRYRLRRLEELCGVDLGDRHQRVALHLWAVARRSSSHHPAVELTELAG